MVTISWYTKSSENSINGFVFSNPYNDIINTLKQETLQALQSENPGTYFHPERDYEISWEVLKKYPEIYNIYLSYITPKYTISKEAREMAKKWLSPTSEEAEAINNWTAELPNMDFFRKHGKWVNAVWATASALAPWAWLTPATEAVQFSKVAASAVPMIPASALLAALTSCDPDDGPLGPKEIDKNDAPKLESSEKNVEAEKWATLSFDGLNLNLWNHIIARFSDDYSKVLSVSSFTIGWKSVTLPYTFSEAWNFNWSLTVQDTWNGTAPSKTQTASWTITVKETEVENQAPEIEQYINQINIYTSTKLTVSDNILTIWEDTIATWKDDHTEKCNVKIIWKDNPEDGWKEIKSGTMLDKPWIIVLQVSDENNETSSIEITITKLEYAAPTIKREKSEITINQPKKLTISDDNLTIWEDIVATWKDDHTEKCNVKITWKDDHTEIKSWTMLDKPWTIVLEVSDENNNVGTAEINLILKENSTPEIVDKITNWTEFKAPWWAKFDVKWNSVWVRYGWRDYEVCLGSDKETSNDKLKWKITQWWQDVNGKRIITNWDVKFQLTDDGSLEWEEVKWDVKTAERTYKIDATTKDSDVMVGLESWNPTLKVDTQVNLLQWLSFKDGWKLNNIFVEQNGNKTEISNPRTPKDAWNVSFIFAVINTESWATHETKKVTREVKENVKEYNAVQFEKADADIYGKREDQKATLVLDNNDYKERHTFFENLWLVEWNAIDEILDQIWWAERDAALERLFYVDVNERPQDWNPWTDWLYKLIWDGVEQWHCNARINVIKSNKKFPWIAQSLKTKILCIDGDWRGDMLREAQSHPNNIYVVWNATSRSWDKRTRDEIKDNIHIQNLKELSKLPNVIICNAIPDNRGEGSNIFAEEWYETDKYVCTYNDRSPKWDRILHVWWCYDNNIFKSIDWKSSTTGIWLWEDPAIVMPSTYPIRLKNWTTDIVNYSPSSYSSLEWFVTKIWTQAPHLTADQIVKIIMDNLIDVPVYWNGQLFTEMKAKTLDFLWIEKALHMAAMPDHLPKSQATALPKSPTWLPIFYEWKGVVVEINGKRLPTTSDNFSTNQSKEDAARYGTFYFDPEIFASQWGKWETTLTEHLLYNGKSLSRLVQKKTISVN